MRVKITAGSNINPSHNIPLAIKYLRKYVAILKLSQFYESPIIGQNGKPMDGPNFINFGILIETALSPSRLKYDVLRNVEEKLHRVRTDNPFEPRPIDLDITYIENRVIKTKDLKIPDPDAIKFAHISLPMRDLNPEFIHPVNGKTLQDIAEEVNHDFISLSSLSETLTEQLV